MSALPYKTTEGTPDGFVAEVYGYSCFIIPEVTNDLIGWRWKILNGNSWTHNSDAKKIVALREGIAFSSSNAEAQILQALDEVVV
ncbi:MAG: hypothetical protein ABIK82_19575 [Pseudomonadota bacterium]